MGHIEFVGINFYCSDNKCKAVCMYLWHGTMVMELRVLNIHNSHSFNYSLIAIPVPITLF